MESVVMNTVLPDIPRIFTALAEWMACVLCVMSMKRRMSGGKLIGIMVGFLGLQSLFLVVTDKREGLWWLLCMLIAIALMFAFIYVCAQVSWVEAMYGCARAFIVAEFMASIEWQLYCYFSSMMSKEIIWFKYLMLMCMYILISSMIRQIDKKVHVSDVGIEVTEKELITAMGIAVVVFTMSNLGFVIVNTPFSGRYSIEIFNIRTIVGVGGLAILYAYHTQWSGTKVRRELENIQGILHNQFIQYEQSQKTIELINYKYHDLKHHIIVLRAEENSAKRNEYLDKMEIEIRNFEAQNKTGHPVLDVLLTSKSLFCQQNDILLTSVIDGCLFQFMDVMDICSIFGNALDNAIECEKKIKEKEKRLIHISASSKMNFLIVCVENYYEGTLTLNEELPATTKRNSEFHGYGLKSLRYTVHKYHGEVDVSVKDNWFILKILIPL